MPVMDVYIRVSRVGAREGDSFRSPAIQRSEAKDWARRNAVTLGKVVEELDVSGGLAAEDRELERLVRRVEQGMTQGVIVPKVSRFARNLRVTADAAGRIIDAGGRLVATEDGYDSAQPGSQVILGALGGLAEHERALSQEGWRKATAGAVEEGVHIACRAPLGYRRRDELEPSGGSNGRLVVDPETAPHVRRAFELRAEGVSYRRICDYLAEALGRD